MADSETTNYQLILPEVGASKSTWGQKLNSNFSVIDDLLKLRLPVKSNGRIADTAFIEGALPTLSLVESDQAANARRWDLEGRDGGVTLSTRTDAGGLIATQFMFDRDGGASANNSVLRRSAADARYLRPNGSGALLTSLNASNLTTGTLPDARLVGAYSMTSLSISNQPSSGSHATRKDYVDAQVAGRLTQTQGDARYLRQSGGTLTGTLTFPADQGLSFPGNGSIYQRANGDVGITGESSATNTIFYGGSGGPATATAPSTILSRQMGDNRYFTLEGTNIGTGPLIVDRPRYGNNALASYGFGLRVGGSSTSTAPDMTQLIRGFNGASTAVFNVAMTGNVANANNSYGALSDERVKSNIADATDQLADLMRLRVVNYTLDQDVTGLKQIGMIAQEVLDVKPGWVDYDETDDLYSLKYSLLPLSLLKGLQELVRRVEALEAA